MTKWIAALVLCLMSYSAHADETVFLSNLDDIPLMRGLVEAEGGMHFDTPSGRIVETYAIGAIKKVQIQSFYMESLPSLGWKQMSETTFEREGEVLTLSLETQEINTVVRFALSPKS